LNRFEQFEIFGWQQAADHAVMFLLSVIDAC